MSAIRLSIVTLALCTGAAAGAAPVTGWTLVDASTGAISPKFLGGAATDSPVIGSGADGSANQVALYAPISGPANAAPDISLVNGQTVTLTGSATIQGNASSMEQFRFGLFYEGALPVDAKGWLGYLANNSAGDSGGALRAKRASYGDFNNQVFAATAASGSATTLHTSRDGGSFIAGTYDFYMSITRTGDDLVIDASLTRGTAFSQTWNQVIVSDPDLLTYDFNRVGFLSGNSLSADRISFNDIDVTTALSPTLTLQVLASGPSAGAMRLVNRSGEPLDFDYYEIASPSGSLHTNGWLSLADQSSSPQLANWFEAGGAGEHLLSEANVAGSTVLAPNGVLQLGRGLGPDGVADLQFSVGLTGDRMVAGLVEYVDPGDFNADGVVNALDLAAWKGGYGTGPVADADFDGDTDGADLLAWQRHLSSPASTGIAAVVPEATSLVLMLSGCLAFATVRRVA